MKKLEKDIIKRILFLAIEDYSGLWEVVWEINTNYPYLGDNEKYLIAKRLVSLLFNKGYIKYYWCKEPYGDIEEIANQETENILNRKDYWEAPENNSIAIRIGITKEGEKEYREKYNKI